MKCVNHVLALVVNYLALDIVNAPTSSAVISQLKETIDVPVVATIVSMLQLDDKISAGADILNVSAAAGTAELVAKIREKHPDVPIIATGGPTDETIIKTINAGANAITWTPPSNGEVFKSIMDAYRQGKPHPDF